MKKIFSFSFLLLFVLMVTFLTTGCTKTDVENDLEQAEKDKQVITDEEFETLSDDPEFRDDYINEMLDADEEKKQNDAMDLINELEDAKADKESGKNIKGSCNDIEDSSSCIDFYGSFFTEQVMRSTCADGLFSFDGCPRDTVGGCNTGVGTPADMVAWLYTRGAEGDSITTASLKNAKNACDATIGSQWLTSR